MKKNKKIFPSVAIVLAIIIISTVALSTGAWFFQNNSASGIIITSNGVKLQYEPNCLDKQGDNYFLKLDNNTNVMPMSVISVTPVKVRKIQQDNYYDCYLRYKFNYFYSLDNGTTYTQAELGDEDLHLSINSRTNGTNFLSSCVGEYTYYTRNTTGTATLRNLQSICITNQVYVIKI